MKTFLHGDNIEIPLENDNDNDGSPVKNNNYISGGDSNTYNECNCNSLPTSNDFCTILI